MIKMYAPFGAYLTETSGEQLCMTSRVEGFGWAGVDLPRGPHGRKRPSDAMGSAVAIVRIATREHEETTLKQPTKVRLGKAGVHARADAFTLE